MILNMRHIYLQYLQSHSNDLPMTEKQDLLKQRIKIHDNKLFMPEMIFILHYYEEKNSQCTA